MLLGAKEAALQARLFAALGQLTGADRSLLAALAKNEWDLQRVADVRRVPWIEVFGALVPALGDLALELRDGLEAN